MSEEAERIESLFLKLVAEEMRKRYSEEVIRHANEPRNVGRMSQPDGCGMITGPCGDTMEFYIKVRGEIIDEILFMTDGCGPTIACGSMATTMVKGMSLGEARKIGDEELDRVLGGLPPDHKHCAKLATDSLHQAIDNVDIE